MRNESGFSLLEVMVSTAVMLAVTAGIFSVLNPANGAYSQEPEVADMQQRLRVGSDTLYKDLVMAGAGAYNGSLTGSLDYFFAPILPYRNGSANDDPPGSFKTNVITLMYVPNTTSQTTMQLHGPSQNSSEIAVNQEPGCPAADPLCGFSIGMNALVYTRYELVRTFRNRRFFIFSFGFPLILYFVIAAPQRNTTDLAGTGISGHDATPSAYAVDTSAVPPGPVTSTGELLQMQGLVTPFGAAPPDFAAHALTPGPNSLQTLVVEWINGGSTAPFTNISTAGLVVNLADANLGTLHEIRTGPATLDLKTLSASPLITSTGADQNHLQLAVGSTTLTNGISVYNNATGFANAVAADFKGSHKIFRLVAYGQYDSATNTFVAARIHVALHE